MLVTARAGTGCSCLVSSLSALPTELGLADVDPEVSPWPGYAGFHWSGACALKEASAEPCPPLWIEKAKGAGRGCFATTGNWDMDESPSDDREGVSRDASDEDKGQPLDGRQRLLRAGPRITCSFSVT